MFNIWKHAWGYADKASRSDDSAAGSTDLIDPDPEYINYADELQSRKRLRDEDRHPNETSNKKIRHEIFPFIDSTKDSVANYLPEVLSKPRNQRLELSRTAVKPSIEDTFEHIKKANSKYNNL